MQNVWVSVDATGTIRQVWMTDPTRFGLPAGSTISLSVPVGVSGHLVGMKVINGRLAGR